MEAGLREMRAAEHVACSVFCGDALMPLPLPLLHADYMAPSCCCPRSSTRCASSAPQRSWMWSERVTASNLAARTDCSKSAPDGRLSLSPASPERTAACTPGRAVLGRAVCSNLAALGGCCRRGLDKLSASWDAGVRALAGHPSRGRERGRQQHARRKPLQRQAAYPSWAPVVHCLRSRGCMNRARRRAASPAGL